MDNSREAEISVLSEVKERNDKKFQSLLSTKEILEYCIQQERLQSESRTWEIKQLQGDNDVAKDKNLLEYQDLDELTHQNEGLKEQIANVESQIEMADLSVALAGIELGEDSRNLSELASSHRIEDKDPERQNKLKSLQQMCNNLRYEIDLIGKTIADLELKIGNGEQVDLIGVGTLLDMAGRMAKSY